MTDTRPEPEAPPQIIPVRPLTVRRRPRGVRVYLEPRDAWIGVYVSNDAVCICPLPFLVIRWKRGSGE
jgi:hypothetical protein